MEWRAKTSRGLVRADNEDSWLVERLPLTGRRLWLAMVADGLGGHEGGEIASFLAVKHTKDYIYRCLLSEHPQTILPKAINYGNQQVLKAASEGKGYPGMGTTLTCGIVDEDNRKLYVGHVGDSRAYLISNGQIRQITEDHSVLGELVRNGTITEEDAMHHPGRNVLTMALGTQPQINVATYEENLLPGDVVLLCTDGLTALVRSVEIVNVLVENTKDEVAEILVDMANDRGGYDNVTVVVLWPEIFCAARSKRGEMP